MIRAGSQDKDNVVALLTEAFRDNRSVNYIVPQDNKQLLRIRCLMAYSFERCLRYGAVWLSDDRKACALLLYPDQKRNTPLLDLQLIMGSVGWRNAGKAVRREAFITAHHPVSAFAYLWFIGVAPNVQGRGTGTRLMREVMHHCSGQQRPVYLETSNERNLSFYQNLGFVIYNQSDRFGYPLYFLREQ